MLLNGNRLRDYDSSQDDEYGDCRVTTCNSGFTRNLQRTTCYRPSDSCYIEDGEGVMRSDECRVVGCNNGFTINETSNTCMRSSTGGGSSIDGNSSSGGSGENGQRCDVPNGYGYINFNVFLPNNGNCVVEQCDSGYLKEANNINTCVARYQECNPIPNGRSRRSYILGEFRYGGCRAYRCTGNTRPSGNSCREDND